MVQDRGAAEHVMRVDRIGIDGRDEGLVSGSRRRRRGLPRSGSTSTGHSPSPSSMPRGQVDRRYRPAARGIGACRRSTSRRRRAAPDPRLDITGGRHTAATPLGEFFPCDLLRELEQSMRAALADARQCRHRGERSTPTGSSTTRASKRNFDAVEMTEAQLGLRIRRRSQKLTGLLAKGDRSPALLIERAPCDSVKSVDRRAGGIETAARLPPHTRTRRHRARRVSPVLARPLVTRRRMSVCAFNGHTVSRPG